MPPPWRGQHRARLPLAVPGRCVAPLRDLEPAAVRSVLEAAAQFRLRRKAARLAQLREVHGTDEALYQALAEALGYKSNKLPFVLLSQRVPLRCSPPAEGARRSPPLRRRRISALG